MKIFFLFSFLIATTLLVQCSSSGMIKKGKSVTNSFIDSVTVKEANLPILIGRDGNVVSIIKIVANKDIVLKSIYLSLKGTTNFGDLENVTIYSTGSSEKFKPESLIFSTVLNPKQRFAAFGDLQIQKGVNYLWVTTKINIHANILNKVVIDFAELQFDDNRKVNPLPHDSFKGNRLALALRSHGEDGVNTYRIPGLVTTNKGTLIAVYDNRYKSAVDLQADVDVGMSRSTDGGNNWEPMKVIMDMGTFGGLPQDQNGIGDPSILVDKQTNTIWVAAIWAHGHPGKRNWTNSKPGLSPSETSQFVLVKSEDDGKTWSSPINITSQIKNPDWFLVLQGPGKGIAMNDGTLVFPAQFKDQNEMPHSTIIYSKDHGVTWKIGAGAKSNTTEAQVVEIENGNLMLNMRDNRGGSRSIAITKDMGKTWIEHSTSRVSLNEPVCMASLDRFFFKNKDGEIKKLLLFSNPNTVKGRYNMTLKISFDEGESWPEKYFTLLDAGIGRGYSCLTQIDDYRVGILYESSVADLTFQIIDLREILKQ